MNTELTYRQAQQMLDNWDMLDPLRDEAAIHAFEIKQAIEKAFQPLEANRDKLSQQVITLLASAQQALEKRRKKEDPKVEPHHHITFSEDGKATWSLPDDMSMEYSEPILDKTAEINRTQQKTRQVEFDPLTRQELADHGLLRGEVLRLFGPICSLGAGPTSNGDGRAKVQRVEQS